MERRAFIACIAAACGLSRFVPITTPSVVLDVADAWPMMITTARLDTILIVSNGHAYTYDRSGIHEIESPLVPWEPIADRRDTRI